MYTAVLQHLVEFGHLDQPQQPQRPRQAHLEQGLMRSPPTHKDNLLSLRGLFRGPYSQL